jgi:hypothetical protein
MSQIPMASSGSSAIPLFFRPHFRPANRALIYVADQRPALRTQTGTRVPLGVEVGVEVDSQRDHRTRVVPRLDFQTPGKFGWSDSNPSAAAPLCARRAASCVFDAV